MAQTEDANIQIGYILYDSVVQNVHLGKNMALAADPRPSPANWNNEANLNEYKENNTWLWAIKPWLYKQQCANSWHPVLTDITVYVTQLGGEQCFRSKYI